MPSFYHVNLPAYNPGPQRIDFSPLSRGIQALTEGIKENRLMSQQKDIGTALAQGGYGEAADKAFGYGDLKTGLSLTQAEQADEDRDFNRNRLLAQDQRAVASANRASEAHNLTMRRGETDLRDRLVKNVSGIAQMIRNETDPSRKSQMVQALINSNPRMGQELSNLGLDPANPDAAMDMILAEARGMTMPSKKDLMTVSPGSVVIDPRTGQPVYTAPPKPPSLDATSRREIFEADEAAQASTNVMQSLDKALDLNKTAYSGPLAQTRGYTTSLFGSEGGANTEELQNVVTQQVLENLKATFGGQPTEGERQILLDVQGSVNKSPEVRRRIFERAKESAQRRLEFNRAKAEGIRSGEYFQPGYRTTPQAAPQQPSVVNDLKQKYGLE